MKVLTLGLGVFGFAINKLLGENNSEMDFYCLELKKDVCDIIKKTREHPYFFKETKLPKNIKVINDYNNIIGEIDLLILAIPTQCVQEAIIGLKNKLKSGVTILNLAKGIDIKSNMTISQLIKKEFLDFNYNYAILSGGMIAEEVIKGKKIGADLACNDKNIGEQIRKLFTCDYFKIDYREDILNIELFGSLKNILAIITGYYEGLGETASSIGYYINEFYNEMKDIVGIYGGNKNIDFSHYSLGGDMIATCFGNSRNRYFGKLIGEGKTGKEAIEILKNEKKNAEGVETLKAVYNKVGNLDGFELTKKFYELIN